MDGRIDSQTAGTTIDVTGQFRHHKLGIRAWSRHGGSREYAIGQGRVCALRRNLVAELSVVVVLTALLSSASASVLASPPASATLRFNVETLQNGGWRLTWDQVPGATSYTVTRIVSDFAVDNNPREGITYRSGIPGTSTSTTLPPGPWHSAPSMHETFMLEAETPSGTVTRANLISCPHAFFLGARASGQYLPRSSFNGGLGDQGAKVYRDVMRNMGMDSASLRAVPVLGTYPAVDADWQHILQMEGSAEDGIKEALLLLHQMRATCQNTPVLMFGFSQGAWVVGDALTRALANADLHEWADDQVVRMGLLADPRYAGKRSDIWYEPYDHRGGGLTGLTTIGVRGPIGARAGVVTSYCWQYDVVCNSTGWYAHGSIYDTCMVGLVTRDMSYALAERTGWTARVPWTPHCNIRSLDNGIVDFEGRSYHLYENRTDRDRKAMWGREIEGPVSRRCLMAKGSRMVALNQFTPLKEGKRPRDRSHQEKRRPHGNVCQSRRDPLACSGLLGDGLPLRLLG